MLVVSELNQLGELTGAPPDGNVMWGLCGDVIGEY